MNNKLVFIVLFLLLSLRLWSADPFIRFSKSSNLFTLTSDGSTIPILVDINDYKGVGIAINNLQQDFEVVAGKKPPIINTANGSENVIIIGTIGKCKFIDNLVSKGQINKTELEDKREKFIITTIDQPYDGVKKALVIAGSDKRGTIYGVYELSRQIGVSPWSWWADVPSVENKNIYVVPGVYTDNEPAVKYRGIFLNDEAPCLTGWVKNTYGTNYGDHRFYSRVFELILRLRGNYLWPAMWSWAFYQDDPLNGKIADEMGVIIGTSHHEPMARNHQEWRRKRKEYGEWDYQKNQKMIDNFFREGIERSKGTEDVITIGMRGDGDAPMSEKTNITLLEKIIKNQRQIIQEVTKRPAKDTPQVWALYKEVLDYYDKGMKVPDDVIMLLCDDNWGNVRRLPNERERMHPGGWGLYYHVDYVGTPRNTKWINVTPIQNMWEQLQLTYDYGVDKLWVLNVGDLKPMEYPINLFLDMAWNPTQYTADNILDHTLKFCAEQLGQDQANEAMRILNLYSKYNGRVTPEMLDCKTYNLETGEWKKVSDEYLKLEAEALRQYITLKPQYRDAYKQLILFPVQATANLYEMYYAQAMNHKLYSENNPEANYWADKVEQAFKRDAELSYDYNNIMSGGKWKNMMIQKHIGYTSWNDNFPEDKLPQIHRIANPETANGKYIFMPSQQYISMEAEHYYDLQNASNANWTVIPFLGRTLSGIALMPYSQSTEGASISYKMHLPNDVRSATVHIVVKSTLAFKNLKGHRYKVQFKGSEGKVINFNSDLNEDPVNRYSIFYPTVARRVVEKKVQLDIPETTDGIQTLILYPLDPGIVFEKIVVDYGGYIESYLYMDESSNRRDVTRSLELKTNQ